jgi:WD40 repeat protein
VIFFLRLRFFGLADAQNQDQKVRLHEWSGTALKEVALLEGNKGVVSALEFSPDGALLAAGDVCLVSFVPSFSV